MTFNKIVKDSPVDKIASVTDDTVIRAHTISEIVVADKGLIDATLALKGCGLLGTVDEKILIRLRAYCLDEIKKLLDAPEEKFSEAK